MRDIVAIINTTITGVNPAPLLTPVNNQITLSAFGSATVAMVLDMDGTVKGEYEVNNGSVTFNVSDLEPGAYLVEIGANSIVFLKNNN